MSNVKVQWFVDCRGDSMSNESLIAALAEVGINEAEVKHPGMIGTDGKLHDVWQIPADFVKKLLAAKRSDSRFKYRFWKRNGSEGEISPADFVEQRVSARKIRDAEQLLAKMRAEAIVAKSKLT